MITNVDSSSSQTRQKICFIAPHFGALPPWINLTLKTFSHNSDYDLIIITDQIQKDLHPYKNVTFYHYSLQDFSQLAAQKTATNIQLKTGYKICDLRPAFGVIFEDYLKGYDFWAHIDLDTFLGDISSFLPALISQGYDIICGSPYHVGGPFCLYKNVTEINFLFRQNPMYIVAFEREDHVDFDEIGIKFENQGFERTVRIQESEGKIRVFRGQQQLCLQDTQSTWWPVQVAKAFPDYPREQTIPDSSSGIWRNGKLFSTTDNQEYMFYHFKTGKKKLFQPFPIHWCNHIESFEVGLNGIKLNYSGLTYQILYLGERGLINLGKFMIYDLGALRHKLGLSRKR